MFTKMTDAQRDRLKQLCANFHVEYAEDNYLPDFDLPQGWVAGWVGPIYVGVSPEGESHS